MSIDDKNLSKEELEYFIEKLSLPHDQTLDGLKNVFPLAASEQAKLQSDLKIRLRRGVEKMRARNEEIPPTLLDLIKRL